MTNASILILLRLRRSDSNWLAALFGLSAAWNLWFHYLFATILPALVLCFFVVKVGQRKAMWRQFWIALAAFALAFPPLIPGLYYLFSTARTHVYEPAAGWPDLVGTFLPGLPWIIFGIVAPLTVLLVQPDWKIHYRRWQILLCVILALIPPLILFGVSAGTPIHCFAHRHRLDAIPGIALSGAMVLGSIRFRSVRLAMCVALVTIVACVAYVSPSSRQHHHSWKFALEAAERNASADNAPVLICSEFAEADYAAMPVDSAQESNYHYFAMLSYYRLSVPVVPLPQALNGEAMRVGSQFLREAAEKHERFLALGFEQSYKTLDWLAQSAAGTYSVRKLGVFDKVEVLEFLPLSVPPTASPLQRSGEPGQVAPFH